MVCSNDLIATQKVVNGLEGNGHIAVEVDVTSEPQIENLKKQVEETAKRDDRAEGGLASDHQVGAEPQDGKLC